jgi:hypothetical protein
MRILEENDEINRTVGDDKPVQLGDRKTIFYFILVALATILLLLIIRFTVF